MSEWKTCKLSEIGDIVGGATPSTKNPQFYDGDIPWITPKDLTNWNNMYISKGERSITKAGYNSASCKMMPKGSVLFTSRAPIGYIAIAANEVCTNQGFKSVVPNTDLIDSQFLYYSLIFNKNKIISMGSGTTFAEISGKVMASVEISLPPLAIQKKIAAQLAEIDDKIAVNKKICENLEAQAQALFKHWFVDFAPFKDGGFVESELGLIPEGWRVGMLGDICKTNKRTYGASFLGIIEYIDTGSVTNNIIDNIQILDSKIDKIPSRARRAITEGDILFSSVRPNQRHFAFMYNPTSRMVASTGFIVITANWSGYRYYIYQYLIQDSVINYLQAIAEQSVSTYPSINASDITNIKVIIPPDDIIGNYAAIMSRFMGEIDRNHQESRSLSTLRDTLLPRLMSGELNLNVTTNL